MREPAPAAGRDVGERFVPRDAPRPAGADSLVAGPKAASDAASRSSALYWAAFFGKTAAVSQLIAAGGDVNEVRWDGNTPLHGAASEGHGGIARMLLDAGAPVAAATASGETPLHGAASKGHGGIARMLLDAGAPVAAATASGETPLHGAASKGRGGIARMLLDAGAPVAAATASGETPLHGAASEGHGGIAKMLLDAGASVAAATASGETPLHLAVRWNEAAVARALIEAGASPTGEYPDRLREKWSIPERGVTHLHVAASRGSPEVAAALIDAGADMEATDAAGRTPLHRAAGGVQKGDGDLANLLATTGQGAAEMHEHGKDGVARLLVEAGANVDATRGDGMTPLHLAASRSRLALAEALLDAGADVDASAAGATPLHVAARRGHLACAELLLRRGAAVDPPRAPGLGSPLLVAIANDWEHVATLLVEHGADANARDENGETAAAIAERERMNGVLVRLLEADGSLRAQDVDPELLAVLLSRAVERDDPDAALRLLDGVDVERLAFAPLHEAAGRGSLRVAEALLDAGYDADVGTALVPAYSPDRDYPLLARAGGAGPFRPLHLAARHESAAVAALLIERGAEIDARDGVGWTPLHYALLEGVERPALRAANLLLEHGADVRAATLVVGWTPLHLAARLGGSRVSSRLDEAGERVWDVAEYADGPDVLRLVRALVERGADANARTRVGGWTPARVAKESDERRRHQRWGLAPGQSSQAVLAALEAAGGRDAGCDGGSTMPVYSFGKGRRVKARAQSRGNGEPECEHDMPFMMPGAAARGPREAAGSFTAPGADERLLLQTAGVRLDTDYYQLASLRDRHGAVHPVAAFDNQTAYHGLCFDRQTETHAAIFAHNHGGDDDGWPKTTYFHYDADAGTLAEAFVEGGLRKPPVGRDEACRWRGKTTGTDSYEDVLEALEKEQAAGPRRFEEESEEASRRRRQAEAASEQGIRADAEALALRALYLESDDLLLDEAGLAELANELAGVLARLNSAYPEFARFPVRRDKPLFGELSVRLRPGFARIVGGVLQDFPLVREEGRPIALRTGHRLFDGLNEKLGLWKIYLYGDSAFLHLHERANVGAAARAYSVLEVVEEAKPREAPWRDSDVEAFRAMDGEGWEIWVYNHWFGPRGREHREVFLFKAEGDAVEHKMGPQVADGS